MMRATRVGSGAGPTALCWPRTLFTCGFLLLYIAGIFDLFGHTLLVAVQG